MTITIDMAEFINLRRRNIPFQYGIKGHVVRLY